MKEKLAMRPDDLKLKCKVSDTQTGRLDHSNTEDMCIRLTPKCNVATTGGVISQMCTCWKEISLGYERLKATILPRKKRAGVNALIICRLEQRACLAKLAFIVYER